MMNRMLGVFALSVVEADGANRAVRRIVKMSSFMASNYPEWILSIVDWKLNCHSGAESVQGVDIVFYSSAKGFLRKSFFIDWFFLALMRLSLEPLVARVGILFFRLLFNAASFFRSRANAISLLRC